MMRSIVMYIYLQTTLSDSSHLTIRHEYSLLHVSRVDRQMLP